MFSAQHSERMEFHMGFFPLVLVNDVECVLHEMNVFLRGWFRWRRRIT